ncbi:iron ABC transporter permease [Labrenzia sp. DG1229]|uniref:ABC transporter permease n=1 Tax=Labrenzia sp. DG1229 TaxID=681847 RepID=UPI000690C243|nr:iron ABC transporter permease [Labrenzia sp. DG1229]
MIKRKPKQGGTREEPTTYAVFGLAWVWLLVLIAYPLVQILVAAFFVSGNFTLSEFYSLLETAYYRRVIANSFRLAAIVATFGTIIALIFALAVTKVDMPGRKLFHIVALVPTISPPFAFGLAVIMLFGRQGLVTHEILGLETSAIYGLNGMAVAQIFGFFPFAYLLLRGVLLGLNPSLEEAASTLGANRLKTLFTVTLPLMTTGIASAFLLLFIYSMADLGNALLIGGNYTVVSSQIYLAIIGQFDFARGAALSVTILFPAVLLFIWQKRLEQRTTYAMVSGRPSGSSTSIRERGIVWSAWAICVLITVIIGAVYLTILAGASTRLWGVNYTPTLDHFRSVFGAGNLGLRALQDTFFLASIAAVVGGVLSLAIGYMVQRVPVRGRGMVDFLSMIPMAVPGVVIGIAYAIAFNKPPLIISGTALIIILLFIVRTMPFGLRMSVAAIGQIDVAIDEASLTLGANRFQTFARVTLPLIRTSFVASIIYMFTRNITSLSAVIFVVSANWTLVTAAMLSEIETGRISVASAFAVVLVVIVVAINIILFRFIERQKTP